jgi:tRNA(Ile)-lysidine synthase
MNLSEGFKKNWEDKFTHLSTANCYLLIAVSGGLDSIVLTDLIYKSGFDFIIAHCNFQMRGEESERDESFVKELGKKYNKEVLIKKFDTTVFSVENKIGTQEAARLLRYQWFKELIDSIKLKDNSEQETIFRHPPSSIFIATAHHADDNIETILMKFFRGTGIQGLTGIQALNQKDNIIRPLLFAGRENIVQYAKENNLTWVEDSSNQLNKYTRNYFRNELIPGLKKVFPNVEENILQNIERFNEVNQLYHQSIKTLKKKLLIKKENEIHIPVLLLQKSNPVKTIIWEIIKDFGFTAMQVDEMIKLFTADNGSYISSQEYRIIKNRNWFIIAPIQQSSNQNILIEKGEKECLFQNGKLTIQSQFISNDSHFTIDQSTSIAFIDSSKIEFPLILRKWKQGDYFYPLGMQKKKKLSRFFIDQKLSLTQKENTWVIESNKKIIWIVGQRIDDRCKITASTKEVVQMTYWK